MKKFTDLIITKNKQIAPEIFDMYLKADELPPIQPGQFVMLYVGKGEHILPRPISICDVYEAEKTIRLVYQVVGKGTEIFSQAKPGDVLKAILPLGNGFDIKEGDKFALVGGGIGVPPLLYTARKLLEANPNAQVTVFLGFKSDKYLDGAFRELNVRRITSTSGVNTDTLFTPDFEKTGYHVKVEVSTDDGKHDTKGNVMKTIGDEFFPYVYACGPRPMLKAIAEYAEKREADAQISAEERMACGIGACVGCVVKMKDGSYKKACVDGPVFDSKEVSFDE